MYGTDGSDDDGSNPVLYITHFFLSLFTFLLIHTASDPLRLLFGISNNDCTKDIGS